MTSYSAGQKRRRFVVVPWPPGKIGVSVTYLLLRTTKVKLSWVYTSILFNSSDGRVVRTSTSGAVDLGLIPNLVKPMTSKLVFTASLVDAQH